MNYAAILAFASAFFCGALALAVIWHERRSVAHWAFAVGMLIFAADGIFAGFTEEVTSPNDIIYWQGWRLLTTSCLPGIWIFFSLSYGRGNFREFLRKWYFILLAAFAAPISLAIVFHDELIVAVDHTKTNHTVFFLGIAGFVLNLLCLIGDILILTNLERTFRASMGTMRWRIKFMILGLGVLFAARAYTNSQILLYHAIDLSLQSVNAVALLVACILIVRSLLRAGHFDMDVYPSQSVLQNSLTVLLAGVYLLIVGVLAKVVAFLGGDAAFPLKAFVVLIALVLLTILLLSEKVRLHTNRFVSRHFQRPMYDYRTVWRRFTEGTTSCVKQSELCNAAIKLVTDIFQTLSVSIWFVDEKKEKLTFAASTFLSENKANDLELQSADAIEIINALRNNQNATDIDSSKANWAIALRQYHPDEFRKGGNRICVPLSTGDEILGALILGDRVGGATFSWQDFDLLKCVADQIAAGLKNVQLSQKLLQAKELEAFQAMSAFFVHDLKNTASTLNLMLKNLPVHFDNPAFREDALRGISKTVAHINNLISRLSLLRHELHIKPVESDLNEVVVKSLSGWEENAGVQLVKDLHPLPKIFLDPDQMTKVVVNLVLNAREAVAREGEVRIETTQNNGCIILAVADNGCGMNPDFLNRSLFRPFQTTKKNGLGIGMFQSKMIIEAHGGRIEVESGQGKGTTFRIILPLQKEKK